MIAVVREQISRICGGDVIQQRGSHVELAWTLKAGRHDADDGVFFILQRDGPSQEIRIPSEAGTPQLIAHDDHLICSGTIFIRQESPPLRRRNAEG